MPSLSVWMIRLSFLHFLGGYMIASLLLSQKGDPELLPVDMWQYLFLHVDMLLVGWMVQLSMGVAYWILPRLPGTVTQRGRLRFALAAVILINGGVACFAVVDSAILVSIGMLMQFAGALAFVHHAVPRVRAALTQR
ncbi:MAG: hypothetical protein L0154_04385 [Chloroflexi bacterium]|nr:hypothetical protein [Chloroflexota bacterium]